MFATTLYSLDRPRQHHCVRENTAIYFSAMPVSAQHAASGTLVRTASLFRNGRNQAVRLPREFEFPPGEVSMYKDG